RDPVISVACHTEDEVARAGKSRADFAVFGPVFEKKNPPRDPTGMEELRSACRYGISVFALGGVSQENAAMCAQAGAVGVAGIRLFQEADVRQSVQTLRALDPDRPIKQ